MPKRIEIKEKILNSYIDHLLIEGVSPVSVYKLCKKLKIEETDFYNNFGSFDQVENYFWELLLKNTVDTCNADSDDSYNAQHSLLTFYYTLFENLKLNRSYLLLLNSSKRSQLELDVKLRKVFLTQFEQLAQKLNSPISKLSKKVGEKLSTEVLWMHFIAIFHFWLNDTSPSFEKTDALIEKSVRAGIDLTENVPTESLFDLGKFVFKEFRNFV